MSESAHGAGAGAGPGAGGKMGWRAKVLREFRAYWVIVAYLALLFAAFTQYRRLLMAAEDIAYTEYGIAIVKAMVLGKVIMIGEALRLARGMDRRPLIYPTLYKTLVFTAFLAVFTMIEHGVKGLFRDEGFAGGVRHWLAKGWAELASSLLVIFVGLIPFFAFREIGRVMGDGKLGRMFFVERGDR